MWKESAFRDSGAIKVGSHAWPGGRTTSVDALGWNRGNEQATDVFSSGCVHRIRGNERSGATAAAGDPDSLLARRHSCAANSDDSPPAHMFARKIASMSPPAKLHRRPRA